MLETCTDDDHNNDDDDDDDDDGDDDDDAVSKTLLVRPRKELKLESYEVSGSVRKHIQKSTTMSLLCFSLHGEMKN